jgi:hypothetical protein
MHPWHSCNGRLVTLSTIEAMRRSARGDRREDCPQHRIEDGRPVTRSTVKPLLLPPAKRGHHAPDRASLGHGLSWYSEGA